MEEGSIIGTFQLIHSEIIKGKKSKNQEFEFRQLNRFRVEETNSTIVIDWSLEDIAVLTKSKSSSSAS